MFSTKTFASAAALVVAVSTAVAAQERTPQQPQADMPRMMQNADMPPDGDMTQMMGMMREMSKMMEACTEMMQARAGEGTPEAPPSQPQNPQ